MSEIERFNKYIKKLVEIVDSSTDLDKSYIEIAFKFLESELKLAPTVLIDHIGPKLKKNETFILNKDTNILKSIASDLPSENKAIYKIFNVLSSRFNTYDDDEKSDIFKILKILLSCYNKFTN